jgi:uncharacterized protein YbaP (TraB family)
MTTVLLAAAIAASLPNVQALPQPPAADASPAMFVVRDADTVVYIFGTFHALDGRTEWFRDRVKSAFDDSGELVLETVIPDGPIRFKPAANGRALPVTPSASFLATTRMAISAGKSQGMQVGNGADNVLRHVAEAQGKPVEGLETLELQLNMFNRMPAATAAPRPKAGEPVESSVDGLTQVMADMQSAWKRGDQSVFAAMLGQLEKSSPDTYRMMFTERNARWADWIAGRMQTPGVVFVAVGAGHLAGKDSLLVRLAELGIPSARMN